MDLVEIRPGVFINPDDFECEKCGSEGYGLGPESGLAVCLNCVREEEGR